MNNVLPLQGIKDVAEHVEKTRFRWRRVVYLARKFSPIDFTFGLYLARKFSPIDVTFVTGQVGV